MGAIDRLRDFLGRVEATWSPEEQEELLDLAHALEERRRGVYVMSPDEREAVLEGLAQAERGEFATDEELEQDRRRFGL